MLRGCFLTTALQRHTAQDRLDTHLKLGHAERLGQVVIGTTLETTDAIRLGAQSRHHDHRCRAAFAQFRQHIQAVQSRQQDVHQDHIETRLARNRQAIATILAPGDLETATLQFFVQVGAQDRVVLDGKYGGFANSYGIHWRVLAILSYAIIE
ncbi:hypothetical protein D3C72_1797370 [compost metagenome]